MPAAYFYPNSELKIKHFRNQNSHKKEKAIDFMAAKPKTLL